MTLGSYKLLQQLQPLRHLILKICGVAQQFIHSIHFFEVALVEANRAEDLQIFESPLFSLLSWHCNLRYRGIKEVGISLGCLGSLSISIIEGSLKSNFRQYGQMKSRGCKSQRREEKKKSEKRKSQKKENAGARKGRKVVNHCVFPIVCGSGGPKSRPAK